MAGVMRRRLRSMKASPVLVMVCSSTLRAFLCQGLLLPGDAQRLALGTVIQSQICQALAEVGR